LVCGDEEQSVEAFQCSKVLRFETKFAGAVNARCCAWHGYDDVSVRQALAGGHAIKFAFHDKDIPAGAMELVAKSLWSLVCTLFLVDRGADNIAVCKNPGCSVTPYFLRGRETQNFCGEVCGNYGKRQSKLKYWNEKGKQKREERLHGDKNVVSKNRTRSKSRFRKTSGARLKGTNKGT
jgi:hypothetical protein